MKAKVFLIVSLYLLLSAIYGGSMGFIGGIYTVRLRDVLQDEFTVNMVNFFFYLTIFTFEIPTGLFADTFGRKNSFVIACFMEFLSMTVYGYANSFFGFVIAEIIGAIGKTFATGAFKAWCVDAIKHYDTTYKLNWVFSAEHSIIRFVCILTAVVGGYIAKLNLSYPFYVSSIGYLIALIIAIVFVREVAFEKKTVSFKSGLSEMKQTADRSWTFLKNTEPFRFVVIMGMIFSFCIMPVNMEWQEVFKKEFGGISSLGIIMGISGVVMTIGSIVSTKIVKNMFHARKILVIAQIGIGISVFLTVYFEDKWSMMIFFLIHELIRGMYSPVRDAFIQECIPSRERATLGSFHSMGEHLTGTISLFVLGLVAKYIGIHFTWMISGGILVIATVFLSTKRRDTQGARPCG